MKNVYPKNEPKILETNFDKLESFGNKYTSEQTLHKISNIRLWIHLCPRRDLQRHKNDKVDRIGKHVPISVSISSNHVEEPIFLCYSDPHYVVASFIGALESLASWVKHKRSFYTLISRQQWKKLGNVLEKLTQRHNRRRQLMVSDMK